jgi:hypothetical protein
MNRESPILLEVVKKTIHDRVNAERSIHWIEEHREIFSQLMADFDLLIQTFNQLSADEVDPKAVNLVEVKNAFDQQALPTIETLAEQRGTTILKRFIRTMRYTNQLMTRGEVTKEKPYLSFNQTSTDEEALVVGGIFHIYEEMIRKLEHSPLQGIKRDKLVDALVEIVSGEPESQLFQAIADKDRLNWIDQYKGFSLEFRQSLGFK